MRSVSSLHFLLKIFTSLLVALFNKINKHIPPYYYAGTLFFVVTLFMTLAMPYRRRYMNYADALLFSIVTLLCYTQSMKAMAMFETERILLASPIAVIILIHVRTVCNATMCALKFCTSNFKLNFLKRCYNCFKARRASSLAEPSLGPSVDTLPETQPLIPPTCT